MAKAAAQERTCCGVIEEAKLQAREKHEARAQPWLALKLTIAVAAAIIAYASYVYVARFCVPMLRRERRALAGRTTGIVFVAVFAALLLMTTWTYTVICLTPPGWARDHVPQSARPLARAPSPRAARTSLGGPSYEQLAPAPVDLARHLAPAPAPPPSPARAEPWAYGGGSSGPRGSDSTDGLPPPRDARRPPTAPVLLPEFRYCAREALVKPFRAHHCRACGACVLKYDHHCPWIGQCVGARNHKFFVNFLEWAGLFCAWVCATLLALNARARGAASGVDPQQIVVIALAGLFALFTLSMLASHVRLICLNQTTVESIAFRNMRAREAWVLRALFPWWDVRGRRGRRAEWDARWGRIGREGNLWWRGGARANWAEAMGGWWPGWILPIGKPGADGLSYVPSARFDAQGRWRPRREWPAGVP